MNERSSRAAAVIGVAALAGGVTAVASGGGSPGLPVLLVVAGGALAAGATYLLVRTWLPGRAVDPPAVERATEFPAPGDEFDRTLAQFDGSGRGYLPDKQSIHSRLRDLATAVLARQGYTDAEAEAAIEDGEWTDDEAVAAFLQDPDVSLPRSWGDRLRSMIGESDDPSDFQTLVGRTVDALVTESAVLGDGEAERSRIPHSDAAGDGEPVRTVDRSTGRTPRTATDGAGNVLDEVATGRWDVAVPAALAFVGFGFALREAAVVLAGAAALGFTAYARASSPPATSLTVERTIDAEHPTPGDEIEITTTIRNDGERTVPDLRIVDGVPPGLSVTDGSPRHGATLRPGESTAFTYEVAARRGTHNFDPAYAVVRGYAGTTASVRLLPSAETAADSLTCVPDLGELPVPVPLYEQTGQYLGRIPAGSGEGVEFHSTREYRPGDPSTRIDWKRLARSATDELTTVQFREERAATVALVVDADPSAYLSPSPDELGAVERSIEAAGRLAGSLLRTGDRVGVAALGPTPLWIDPGTGLDHRKRVEDVLAGDPALPPTPPETDNFNPYWAKEFHRRYPAETQIVLLSPLCGRRYRYLIRQLRGLGHPVTIVSPDPTVDGTVGRRLVRAERRLRIEDLRAAGVRVVDWDPAEEDVALALGRAAERWST